MDEATYSQRVEFLKCAASPAYFVNTYCMIDEPQGSGVSVLPFKLWPAQFNVMNQLHTERQAIILKARQLGISWLVCAFVLWLCLFQAGRVVLLFSKGQLEANELARRIGVLYARLPDWLRAMLPPLTTDNTKELGWGNGSVIRSLPATRTAGRSFTASLVVMDEAAFMDHANFLYTAIKPTIDGGGKLIILSSANGQGNLFAKLWKGAKEGKNNITPIFLPWWSRPGRDLKWRARIEADATPGLEFLVDQEYPAIPADAFQNTGNVAFLPSMAWWDALRQPIPALRKDESMVIALDAAVSGDSFGLVAVTYHPAIEGVIVPRIIAEWKPPKGGEIDYVGTEDAPGPELVLAKIIKHFNVVQVTGDPHQLHYLFTRLKNDGEVYVSKFDQGGERLEADAQLLKLITQRRLAHDGNAKLRAHIENADRKVDEESKRLRLVKRENSLKIDLAVCLSMAAHRLLKLAI